MTDRRYAEKPDRIAMRVVICPGKICGLTDGGQCCPALWEVFEVGGSPRITVISNGVPTDKQIFNLMSVE